MLALIVLIWFILGITAVHLEIIFDINHGWGNPPPWCVWVATGGPITLFVVILTILIHGVSEQ